MNNAVLKQMTYVITMPFFINILLLFFGILQGALTCPSGWVSYNSRCYLFVTNTTSNWNSARQYCVTKSSVLTEIGSPAEDRFLSQFIHFNVHHRDYWIGGIRSMNTWIWTSSHTSIRHYTSWGVGEPNNKLNEESCIELNRMKNYQWNDERCTEHNYFICEQPNTWQFNTHKPNVPHAPDTTKFWLTLQIYTSKPYAPPITTTTTGTKTTSTTTTTTPVPQTTTNTAVPPTTKRLQFVTLPRNPQNPQHTQMANGSNPRQIFG